MWVPIKSGNRSGSCSENCGFRIGQVVRGHSENGIFVFREWNFEFRELLREYPGTLRELREWPFRSESVFPEIGVVPRLLTRGFSEVFQSPLRDPLRGRFLSQRLSGVKTLSLKGQTRLGGNRTRNSERKIALCQKRPFVHNSVCPQFWEGLFRNSG